MAPTNRNILLPVIFLATTVSVLLIVARSREATPTQATSPAANQPSPASLTSPDPTLAREIDRLIDESGLAQARWAWL